MEKTRGSNSAADQHSGDTKTRDKADNGTIPARRNFSVYLDNSIEAEESVAIKRHLMICGSCREALAELEWIVEHLKSFPDVDPPNGLVPDIMASIQNGAAPVVDRPRSSA